jgi:hypothetical protein
MIVSSYVKKQENLDYLSQNEETFLEWMGKNHSPVSLAHTLLHMDTFDDAYVEKLRKQIEKKDAAIAAEAAARAAQPKPKAPRKKKTVIEKKIEAAEAKATQQEETEEFLFE